MAQHPLGVAANRSSRKTSGRKKALAPAKPPEPFGAGMAIGVVLCLIIPAGLFIWLMVGLVEVVTPELRAAFGHAGTPGTATVVSCEPYTVGSWRSRQTRYDCDARFVFDDRSKQPIVVDTVPEVKVGEVFPAVLTPERDRVLPAGERGVWRAVLVPSGIAFGLAVMAFFCTLLTGSRKMIIWSGALGSLLLIVMIVAIVVGA